MPDNRDAAGRPAGACLLAERSLFFFSRRDGDAIARPCHAKNLDSRLRANVTNACKWRGDSEAAPLPSGGRWPLQVAVGRQRDARGSLGNCGRNEAELGLEWQKSVFLIKLMCIDISPVVLTSQAV